MKTYTTNVQAGAVQRNTNSEDSKRLQTTTLQRRPATTVSVPRAKSKYALRLKTIVSPTRHSRGSPKTLQSMRPSTVVRFQVQPGKLCPMLTSNSKACANLAYAFRYKVDVARRVTACRGSLCQTLGMKIPKGELRLGIFVDVHRNHNTTIYKHWYTCHSISLAMIIQ